MTLARVQEQHLPELAHVAEVDLRSAVREANAQMGVLVGAKAGPLVQRDLGLVRIEGSVKEIDHPASSAHVGHGQHVPVGRHVIHHEKMAPSLRVARFGRLFGSLW